MIKMAEECGFFEDKAYGPDDFTSYFRDFYSNGIKAENANYLSVAPKSGMEVVVGKGIAYIDGHFYRPADDIVITLAESDTEFTRIDLIIIKCDYVNRNIYVEAVTGEPSETPKIPALQRDASAYCLGLAAVEIPPSSSEILSKNITDLRFDTDYCGIVAGKIKTIDTTALFKQYEAQWELLKAGCAQDSAAVIAAWNKLIAVKTINGIVPTDGEVTLTQSLIPSDGTAYQMPYYVQSGTVSVGSTAYNGVKLTFPKAFLGEPILLIGATVDSANGSLSVIANYKELTKDGFTLFARRFNSNGITSISNNTPAVIGWVALGKI